MKKIYIIHLLILVTALAIADVMSETGIAGKTNSPGENNCTGCHTSFPVNSGPGSITISSSNLTNWEYVPGQVYHIDVTVAQTTVPLFGFGFEALKTSDNKSTGTFGITNSTETQLKIVNINGSNRTNVVHKHNGGLTTDTHTFSFNWTAPTTNVGNIKFYSAGNASDDQGDSLNDYIYTTSQLVTPLTTGISTSASNEIVKVYPNPAHRYLNIQIPSDFSSSCNFKLYDCQGNVVMNDSRENISTHLPLNIQLPSFIVNGIYFLKTTDDNNVFTTKVSVFN